MKKLLALSCGGYIFTSWKDAIGYNQFAVLTRDYTKQPLAIDYFHVKTNKISNGKNFGMQRMYH